MKPCHRLSTVLLVIAVMAAAGARAQVANNINVTAVGGAASIQIDVALDIGGTLPSSWVGWVVDRRTIGLCEPEARVGDVTPFAAGPHTYQLNDADVTGDVTYCYRVFAVDDQGGRHYLGMPPEFPPGYYHDAYASLGGGGKVARGVLVDLGWTLGINVCPGFCWEPVAFISGPPPELAAEVGSGAVVMIRGSLTNEFEGPYIQEVTDWFFAGECGTLPATPASWGGLKAIYR